MDLTWRTIGHRKIRIHVSREIHYQQILNKRFEELKYIDFEPINAFNLFVDNLQCFGNLPYLVKSKNPEYGDLCRNDNYPKNMNWRCPKDCVKTSNNKKPFCKNYKKNKNNKTNACRVSKGNF